MLFNSFPFIFMFLPAVVLGFYLLARVSHAGAASWLALSSLFFYGFWSPRYVGLLAGSIAANFVLGRWIALAHARQAERRKKQLLVVALAANICALAYYKYANFFIGNVNDILGTAWHIGKIILPLGISFFTFTQIAFLVDAYQGKVARIQLRALRAVRHLLPAPDRRAGAAPQGDDAAVRARRDLPLRLRQLRRSA